MSYRQSTTFTALLGFLVCVARTYRHLAVEERHDSRRNRQNKTGDPIVKEEDILGGRVVLEREAPQVRVARLCRSWEGCRERDFAHGRLKPSTKRMKACGVLPVNPQVQVSSTRRATMEEKGYIHVLLPLVVGPSTTHQF